MQNKEFGLNTENIGCFGFRFGVQRETLKKRPQQQSGYSERNNCKRISQQFYVQ